MNGSKTGIDTGLESSGTLKGKDGVIAFSVFVFLFFLVHVAYSYFYAHSQELQSSLAWQIVIRLGTWTLPVLIYLAVSGVNPFSYLKLTRNIPKGILWGILIGALILAVNLIKVYLLSGRFSINLNIGMDFWWKGIILVGLSEEVFFRGFVLQKINERTGFWLANTINAVLFVLVHVIGWLLLNQFVLMVKLREMVVLLIFALLQGYVLKKTKSLWACMIIHSFNNFTSVAAII